MVGSKTGVIILFEKDGCGTVVVSTLEQQPLGHHSNSWVMSYFTPLPPTESVTLQND